MNTGVVLAGGRGERLGAPVKPLVPFRGRALLAYALDALAPHCGEILVMAGPHGALLSRVASGARVLGDPGAGPHVALALAARVARGRALLVAPADAPGLDAGAYRALLAEGPHAVARDGAGVNPLVAVYDRGALLDAMRAPTRSLQEVVARLGARAVALPAAALRDIDTPEELRAAHDRKRGLDTHS